MHSSREAVILVVISFLVVALVFSLYSIPAVFALKRGPISCQALNNQLELRCCQTETDSQGLEINWCVICDNTDPPSNCTQRHIATSPNPPTPPPPLNILPPSSSPPSNALPPPSQTCPGGLAPDANGNCPTTKTNQQVAPSQNLASNNNNPPPSHHHKGQESTTKKDNDGGSQQQAPP